MVYSHLPSRFSDVDSAADTDAYVAYLDFVAGLPGAAAYKETSFELLDPAPGQRILEVGCGTGDDAREVARRVAPGGAVVAVDSSLAMVEEARRRGEDDDAELAVRYEVDDALALDAADDDFDGCRVERVLQHLDRPDDAVGELVRVTRPGGRVVVVEPDWETLVVTAPVRDLTRRILHHSCDMIPGGWMGRKLVPCLRQAGLDDVRVRVGALSSTDYDEADAVMRLRSFAARARQDGVVQGSEARRWLDSLALLDADGSFFCALTVFVAVGTVPA